MHTVTALKIPGSHALPSFVDKDERAVADTVILDLDTITTWKKPAFQRPVVINEKVREAAKEMQTEAAKDPDEAWCRIAGTIHLGKLGRDTYLIDGQHRAASFGLACGPEVLIHGGILCKQAIAEVSVKRYDSMGEMARAFAKVNTSLNPIKPDDIMRAYATDNEYLTQIMEACPMIGFDRTGDAKKTTLLSMSAAIRTWFGSGGLVPANGPSARETIKYLSAESTEHIIEFFRATMEAGWNNLAFQPLWGTLNLGIQMWLWRRVVLGQRTGMSGHGGQMPMVVTHEQYVKCMRKLSSDAEYLHHLRGRSLRFQDRTPTYTRIKEIYRPKLIELGIENPRFPISSDWGG